MHLIIPVIPKGSNLPTPLEQEAASGMSFYKLSAKLEPIAVRLSLTERGQ